MGANNHDILPERMCEHINTRFNEELQKQIDGTLPVGHIYRLGMPGTILRSTGFPDLPMELSSTVLKEHARLDRHPFHVLEVKNLVNALQHPVAVFRYGNPAKAQNVIIEIQQGGKNYLVGVHFNQEREGVKISSLRGIFPKPNQEWLNWITQGKLLYVDKEKIQILISKQRMTPADLTYLDLDFATKIVKNFENPKVIGEKQEEKQDRRQGAGLRHREKSKKNCGLKR